MQYDPPVSRANLSDIAANAIRDLIVDGDLTAGERLNEVRLSERLGVSRTPLREALNRLVAEGALIARPKLGYSVKPLSGEEFDQIYDLRPILDPAALNAAGIPSTEQLKRLRKINAKLAGARTPAAAIDLDDEWHVALIEHCPNKALLDMIETVTRRTRRYEIALMREAPTIGLATTHHQDVMDALEQDRLDDACAALKENLEYGKAPIMTWLESRETEARKTA